MADTFKPRFVYTGMIDEINQSNFELKRKAKEMRERIKELHGKDKKKAQKSFNSWKKKQYDTRYIRVEKLHKKKYLSPTEKAQITAAYNRAMPRKGPSVQSWHIDKQRGESDIAYWKRVKKIKENLGLPAYSSRIDMQMLGKPTFDAQGNPEWTEGGFLMKHIKIDRAEFVKNPAKYIRKILKEYNPDAIRSMHGQYKGTDGTSDFKRFIQSVGKIVMQYASNPHTFTGFVLQFDVDLIREGNTNGKTQKGKTAKARTKSK